MKRVLLLGIILAICILLMPQGVSAAGLDSQAAVVNATITNICDINAKWVGGSWVLNRNIGAPNLADNLKAKAINVSVDSTSAWSLKMSDEKSTNKGYMVAKTGTANALQSLFQIANAGGTNQNLTVERFPQTGPSQALTYYDFDVWQQVLPGDRSDAEYEITVTYTLTNL